jgi:hypothetical protein
MSGSLLRRRTLLVLPAVLLTVSLLEDAVSYKVRQHVHDVHVRVVLLVVLYGAAFAVAGDWVSPRIERFFAVVRSDSRKEGGRAGLLIFYAFAYGALAYAYYVEETRGPAALLPPAWR